MKTIKVAVIDDQHLIREGIASLLDLQEGIEVVGSAENGQRGLNLIHEKKPDVVLMDIRMPVLDGIAATQKLKNEGDKAKIIMLTTFNDEEYIVKSLKAGAIGYLMKDIPVEELSDAIKMAMNDRYQIDKNIMGILINKIDHPVKNNSYSEEHQTIWNNFSQKEQEIIKCLARGDSNKEIAEQVYLSEGTVKNYISNILVALGVADRVKAAILANKNGWIW
ncbi:MAG: response regulator transcription factor [Spirochaetales bacterium]|nr:response regulator transcription factor [Spirochaetales bacterium]